jgi:hypothetical protein
MIMTDTFIVKPGNKVIVLTRTESRFFDITNCRVLTDGVISDGDGLVPEARPVSNEFVAEIVAKSARAKVRRSNIKRFQKELV